MPIKYKPTKEIKCLCGKNTIVNVKPATAYCEITRFFCGCGRIYHIHDYYNGIMTWRLVTKEFDNKWYKDNVMRHKKTINVSFNQLSAWQNWLDEGGDGSDEVAYTFSTEFEDCGEGKVEIDIKLCDSRDGTPYIDAVMFQDGHQVGLLEPSDKIAGEYPFTGFLKDDYIVIIPDTIKQAKEEQKKYRKVEKWLESLPKDKIVEIYHKVSLTQKVDKDYLIELILDSVESDDNVLNSLFKQSSEQSPE